MGKVTVVGPTGSSGFMDPVWNIEAERLARWLSECLLPSLRTGVGFLEATWRKARAESRLPQLPSSTMPSPGYKQQRPAVVT